MPISHHYADINDVSLHYVEAACHSDNPHPETIIFLHGFPEYWGTWQAQIEYFREQYHVIVPDLMGYNLSDKPSELPLLSDRYFDKETLIYVCENKVCLRPENTTSKALKQIKDL